MKSADVTTNCHMALTKQQTSNPPAWQLFHAKITNTVCAAGATLDSLSLANKPNSESNYAQKAVWLIIMKKKDAFRSGRKGKARVCKYSEHFQKRLQFKTAHLEKKRGSTRKSVSWRRWMITWKKEGG